MSKKTVDESSTQDQWYQVSVPLTADYLLPPADKVVLVWLQGKYLPFCGYLTHAAGDPACPYFVVYHSNPGITTDVIAWCDCLPDHAPPSVTSRIYARAQKGILA